MIRVLFPSTGIGVGGLSYAEAMIARTLSKQDEYEVLVAVASPGKVSEIYERYGLVVHYYGLERYVSSLRYTEKTGAKIKATLSYFAACRLAYKFLNQFKPDILHISDTQAVIIWGIAAKFMRIPVVWHVHGEKSLGITDKLRLFLSDHLIFVAEQNKVRFRKYKSLPPSEVIYNVVAPDIFSPSEKKGNQRGDFTIDDNAVVIGHIGNYLSLKRPDWVARIVSDLLEEGLDVICIFAGEKKISDKTFHAVKKIVETSGVPEKFYLLDYQKNVQKIMSKIDILVLPTTTEGMPLVILEAMACKVAVVSTCVGGIPEVIQDNVNGLLFDVGDYAGMRDGVRNLVMNYELREKISSEGYSSVHRKHLPSHSISYYKQLYEKILR